MSLQWREVEVGHCYYQYINSSKLDNMKDIIAYEFMLDIMWALNILD